MLSKYINDGFMIVHFFVNFQVAAQVEEMTAEANKERKLRARSDQVN